MTSYNTNSARDLAAQGSVVLDIDAMQREHDLWRRRNFHDQAVLLEDQVLGCCEEAGEMAHHLLKLRAGIRGGEQEHVEGIIDAGCDFMVFFMGVCTQLGVNMELEFAKVWQKVKQRDWINDPERGGE